MQYRLCLTLKSSVAEVERLSREFGLFADRLNLSKEVRFAVNLALEEAVMNVIMLGSKGRDDQPIGVEVVVGAGEVTAQVEDGGPEFDPLQLPPPDVTAPLEQRRVGGLGVFLSQKMLDELRYSRVDGKNRLNMRKRLHT